MTTGATFFSHPGRLHIEPRRSGNGMREWNKKPRLYVWSDVPEDVLEQLVNRRQRPTDVYREGVRAVLAATGVDLTTTGMRWDQHAGCSCPCSPGFVLPKQTLYLPASAPFPSTSHFDVSVTLTDAPLTKGDLL